MSQRPICLTMGDPAGIGPEVVEKALAREEVRALGPFVVIGDPAILGELTGGVELRAAGVAPGPAKKIAGKLSAESGRASFAAVEEGVRLALSGEAAALVTAPMHTEAWALAGIECPGHTELLGERCGAKPVMLMVGGGLRVGLATIHVPLAEVPGLLTRERIVETGRVMAAALKADFGIAAPRIAVLGLNPHASDGGRFGDEEQRIVAPAVEELRAAGVEVRGPEVPDVAFHRALAGESDAVLALYHDQGCIPVKTLAFDSGVNCTLGLPVVRTSPDHGTAFEIAGQGAASENSMVAAIVLAAEIAGRRGLRPEARGLSEPLK